MSRDASETDTRTADERALLNHIERCRFCGSENMTADSGWTRVKSHSHEGARVTTIECCDCGGSLVTTERGNKRSTTMDDMTLAGQHWEIPEGHALSVCDGCGDVAGVHDTDADGALLDAIREGRITTTCCDATGSIERGWFDVPVGGDR